MTVMYAEAVSLHSWDEDDMPIFVEPVYETIWDWLEDNAEDIYSDASEAVRHAQYVSLADDLSRFIAEECPAYLLQPLVEDAPEELDAEWREGARLDILGRFEDFDLDELFADIGPIQLEHAEEFLCNEYGDCRSVAEVESDEAELDVGEGEGEADQQVAE